MRRRAVGAQRLARACGLTREEAARRLGVALRTLSGWERAWREGRRRAKPRGRPARRASAETRRRVRVFVYGLGPGVGLPRVQAAFPGEARREIECILASFRRACRRTAQIDLARLEWRRSGTAWSLDYTAPDEPIEDGFEAILAVRDLSSGYRLLERPVRRADAEATAAALEQLFREHGAPLVLKADNGKHFTAASVRALLERWGVRLLLSPAYTPSYNGSIESAIGALKGSVSYIARREGRDGAWSSADIEEARRLANDTLRPRGVNGPTPTESWRARMPIEDGERERFRARAAEIEQEVAAREGRTTPRAKRVAARRASEEYGILVIGRRRVRLSKRQLRRAKIS